MVGGEFKSHIGNYARGIGCYGVIKSCCDTLKESLTSKECPTYLVVKANGLVNSAIMDLQKYGTCGGSMLKKNKFTSYEEDYDSAQGS